ncbi:hypothetical protein [Celeribacter indicus]|uniref:Uncharacterized protein n=1 Tax=Celeribacter indicus TaxID=1208324 RepID=A0A0B5E7J9_9RHOB|nr:hypothetical protein [Celeribacter indicus]AJE49041.1 hypothetical protein P73_4326 [Celeribacter indicus]SDW44413.1 hypothetical protein SAMN05443573_103250 [Celeribacter indicus]
MPGEEDRLCELEGRIIAHRRLLVRLMGAMDPGAREEHLRWIADREILHDGQEDPGAVPTGTEALSLSIAEEFKEIAELARARFADEA